MWFAVWLAVAAWLATPAWRSWIGAAVALAAAGIAAAMWRGPLAGHLVVMDQAWLQVIHDKDYLFPLAWPLMPG